MPISDSASSSTISRRVTAVRDRERCFDDRRELRRQRRQRHVGKLLFGGWRSIERPTSLSATIVPPASTAMNPELKLR